MSIIPGFWIEKRGWDQKSLIQLWLVIVFMQRGTKPTRLDMIVIFCCHKGNIGIDISKGDIDHQSPVYIKRPRAPLVAI